MTRTILFLLMLFSGMSLNAQVYAARAKLNGNLSFPHYGEIGATCQFDRFFTVGMYANTVRENLRVDNPESQPIYNPQLNSGMSVMLCAGMASYAPEKIHVTGLAGLSLGEFRVHDDVGLIPHPSGAMQISSTPTYKTLIGFSLRGELTFALSEKFGLTGGILGNVNRYFAYYRIYFGLSIGQLGRDR